MCISAKYNIFAKNLIFVVMEEEYIKLIFGLKLKQIRTDKNLSLFGLSKLSGLSKSYLNEIENGKKYPKPDKIAILSEKLDVPYDQMVSLKLDKNLAPIGDILQSKILKEIPGGKRQVTRASGMEATSSVFGKNEHFFPSLKTPPKVLPEIDPPPGISER